jgi:hypothetical protein
MGSRTRAMRCTMARFTAHVPRRDIPLALPVSSRRLCALASRQCWRPGASAEPERCRDGMMLAGRNTMLGAEAGRPAWRPIRRLSIPGSQLPDRPPEPLECRVHASLP